MSKEVSGIGSITHAHCLRCGRKLHAAASKARGFGRYCWGRVLARLAALEGFTRDQLEKARELIEDGSLTRIRDGIVQLVSADGLRKYLTAITGQCNCPSGLRARVRARLCFHIAAARAVFT